MKNYLKSYLYLFTTILSSSLILSIINYFINIKVTIIKIIIPLIAIFISSIILGKNTKEKAYLAGLKFSTIYLAIVTFIKLIFKSSFNYKIIIIYITIILISMIGSMWGINLKNKA